MATKIILMNINTDRNTTKIHEGIKTWNIYICCHSAVVSISLLYYMAVYYCHPYRDNCTIPIVVITVVILSTGNCFYTIQNPCETIVRIWASVWIVIYALLYQGVWWKSRLREWRRNLYKWFFLFYYIYIVSDIVLLVQDMLLQLQCVCVVVWMCGHNCQHYQQCQCKLLPIGCSLSRICR